MGNREEFHDEAIKATVEIIAQADGGLDVLRKIASDWSLFDRGKTSWARSVLEVTRYVLSKSGDL